ncbi:FliH/SctL family protein [Dasania sp. GY-MA-18]|uniref:Flagellar assembly protein FliH n=1 Tax=Dasania phycosphaerae TaxID=2950436 RepID=A0A9J6RI27_9GAMM|nr:MULTISPECIES: FliH/SctL family protein [Dasania]MCR8921656.1 FliH/SctL family protein [Dasania sp. GY-MA-18]MCZ0864084.1 FliH/SctL family protein [Dasania phycosphaerae]MCZ0867812.1 FliH/SctL family protein [Dasania phycosphaerae]
MKNTDRIPAVQSLSFPRWELPEVNEGQIVQAEKTRRDIARGEAPSIDKNLVVYSKLTVGQIEEISQRIKQDVQQQAYQEGLQQGLDKGYRAGLQKGQKQIQQHLERLQSITAQLNDALQAQDNELEQVLVDLATGVAESILQRELSLDASHIQRVIHDAIAAIDAQAQKVDIYLNPQDYKFVTDMGQVEPQWQLHADASVSAGGCRVSNQYSVADYSTEQQFQQTVRQLVDSRYAELASDQAALLTKPADDQSGPGA